MGNVRIRQRLRVRISASLSTQSRSMAAGRRENRRKGEIDVIGLVSTYSLVQVNRVLPRHDIGDGRATLLSLVLVRHFCEKTNWVRRYPFFFSSSNCNEYSLADGGRVAAGCWSGQAGKVRKFLVEVVFKCASLRIGPCDWLWN